MPGATTGQVNGTEPVADSAWIPVYQGSTHLLSDAANPVPYSAKPSEFSAATLPTQMEVLNPRDTEGDTFATSPLDWQNHEEAPAATVVWADAATPDTPLDPQPVSNLTFCEQNLTDRHLVAWAQVPESETPPALQLFTLTGLPNSAPIPIAVKKYAIDIAPSVSSPVAVSASHYDESFKAAKVKVGESITLTITTKNCSGEVFPNATFIITRKDAIDRKDVVNNTSPVHIGDTELTTTATEYRGRTGADGTATVTVTQATGPGVRTPLTVRAGNRAALSDSVDVIFTTLTSPDSPEAKMYGHMQDSETAELNGVTYTFTRPKLAAETSGAGGTIVKDNETWAQFNWSGADNHCDILPDAEQLMAARNAHSTSATYPGWPLGEYWSSTRDQLNTYHYGVDLNNGIVKLEDNASLFLVSCVDKAQPPAHPKITLSPEGPGPYIAKVGESIDILVSVVDSVTQKPLPYRYVELFIDSATNRKGVSKAEWDNLPVTAASEGIHASSPDHYVGTTDANGQIHLTLTHDRGVGVETPIRLVMPDDEGAQVTEPFSVIFTVITSPDVDGANMWGHMQGMIEAGNLYKRPMLAVEADHKTGTKDENNETWATFNTVTAAENQCGKGQVPGQLSLDSLYATHSDNTMETLYGWPTADYYIAADTDGSQTARVNLETGADDMFSGNEENYLSCSGNEMVTIIDAWFNNDQTRQDETAKISESITLHVHSVNALNNMAVPFADFSITMATGRNRAGLMTGFTDPTQGALTFTDGSGSHVYGPAQGSMVYHGQTDAQGNAEIVITQPKGVGLKTMLSLEAMDSLIRTPATRSVTFTVPTSPDTPTAQMWGHMDDTLTVNGMTFERPKLQAEAPSSTRNQVENNETWTRVYHTDADGNVESGGCAANHLPRIDQLNALYNDNSGNDIHTVHGWPVLRDYWSSSFASASTWNTLSLSTGAVSGVGNTDTFYVSCLRDENPQAATITIEPVDDSLWFDANDEHALKVKKGDELKLKVTVKDASGNPLPGAPFVLSRGDGYNRQNEKHIAGSGDGIVSPVVIDGESLNDATTKMGLQTGSDGSRIITVTRPDTHGTKVAITAALYNNPGVSASVDTIFTVVTSPDTVKATMWGHMPEQVTAKDGTVFERPRLASEITDVSVKGNVENNETWSIADYLQVAQVCGAEYVPTFTSLTSLYDAWPSGAINSQQGWPVNGKTYQTRTPGFITPIKQQSLERRWLKSMNLKDASVLLLASTQYSKTEQSYFVCQKNAVPVATKLLLAVDPYNEQHKAGKAKVGEAITLTITTLSAAGEPVPNAPFVFRSISATGRADTDLYMSGDSSELTLNGYVIGPITGSNPSFFSTNAEGTLTLQIKQDDGVGYLNLVDLNIDDNDASKQSLRFIFTVPSSPDVEKANYWGHMPDQLTSSDGKVYRRPKLAAELPSAPDRTTYTITRSIGADPKGEVWPVFTVEEAWNGTNGGCGRDYLPTVSDLHTLYATYPNGDIHNVQGWPARNESSPRPYSDGWASDYSVTNNELDYAAVSLYDNRVFRVLADNSSGYYMQQYCLVSPVKHRVASQLTLTSVNWNEAQGAAIAKKGETIPMVVAVTDASGQPVANEAVKITRSNAKTRSGSNWSRNNSDDITFLNVTGSDGTSSTTKLADTTGMLYVQTNAQGLVTFDVAQENTEGLQTLLTAELGSNSTIQDSKNVRFTVITSPDSEKAKMWGHMPDTITASNGLVFQRPLLRAELSNNANTSATTASNEEWYTIKLTSINNSSDCPPARMPLLNDLKTLYNDYPQGQLSTEFGLPVSAGWAWAGIDKAFKSHTAAPSYWQTIVLNTGATASDVASSSYAAQLCLAQPRNVQIALVSDKAWDSEKSGYVAKQGETLPLTVKITDDAGRSIPGVTFKLTRADSYTRNKPGDPGAGGKKPGPAVLQENVAMTLTSVSPDTDSVSWGSGSKDWYGLTAADGTARLTLDQQTALGLRTGITATLAYGSIPVTKDERAGIFTVPTSPDSSVAAYWGHMPDTVEVNGHTLQRPPLKAEISITPSDTWTIDKEVWAGMFVNQDGKSGASIVTTCGGNDNIATMADLKALRATIGELHWPASAPGSSGYGYLAQDEDGDGAYCAFNEATGEENCDFDTDEGGLFRSCLIR
ncbi:DUF823 domain-containing adhesin [Superficieibacter sp. HKU1]|uniref:adhesion domain-containing protein n=1 Tax=Superficieibacter sp. HKU1 TaxID=3031919 RepID=UPI0023E310E3|nr:DUF823 domain-containing adhesin [Superficieibacter sp. HKU1]WES67077.1 DUF823 domain-containing adhesin [Superficieibacter sp. HKU1]